ncbi:MAG: PRC-barrel domain-containing protein [Fibrobacterota bacterium]
MITSLKKMRDYRVSATDGEIGKVDEFFIDDHNWTIRYLAVDAGHWFHKKKVLLPAEALNHTQNHALIVDRTKQQVSRSPDIESFRHISRSQEIELLDHYNAPYYWDRPQYTPARLYNPNTGLNFIGEKYPVDQSRDSVERRDADILQHAKNHEASTTTHEHHLQESKELIGYTMHAADGDIGPVHNMAVDDQHWVIRYLVVDAGNWLRHREILVAPQWIESVRWEDRRIETFFHRQMFKNSPEFNKSFPIARDYEEKIFSYYKQPPYWESR